MKKKILLILSLFTFISPILFAQAPDSLVGKKLSLNFNVPENDAIGVHEFFLTDSVTSIGNYFKTSNDLSDNAYWLTELYNYKKSDTTNGAVRIISSDGGWVDIVLIFSSSTSASSTISGYAKNGTLEWSGTGDVTMTNLAISEIATSYQPNVLTSNFAPTSIAAGSLSAQDKYWPVYDETITFSTSGTFNANITNGSDNPTGTGNYTYTYTGINSAILSYSIDGAGISFEYALQFTGANTGIYTKYANYGGGTTDVTTGPFTLTGVAVPEQFSWEDYDDCNGSKIETSRWSLGYWDGGNAPSLGNGKITFSGNTVSGFKTVLPTTGMLAFNSGIKDTLETSFASSDSKQSHSFLELANNDVKGIEVEVQLPMDVDSNTAIGLYTSDWSKAFSSDQSDKSFFGLDLWRDHIDIEYVDPQTGSMVSSNLTTQPGKSHIFSFLFKNGMVSMYVDGAKVAEFSSANFSRDSIVVRSWNNAGTPFSAHLKNARVLRNWEDYDQFSDNLLDTSKWTATNNYFVGNQPTEVNGRIELSGLTSQNSNKNVFLLFKNSEGINGVEADIWLPSNAPVDTGVLIGISDAGTPVGYLDLWAGSAQTHFSINLGNSATGEAIDFTRNADLGKSYKVAIIKGEQKTALYLEGEKVAEVSTWQSNNLDIIFRGVNDAGSSFTAYLDNVRVLRDWEDYDDFSGSSLDTSKWGTMNFYGGDKPEVKDGRVEFSSSGKSVSATSDFKQGWNSTEFINYTEGAPGSVLYVNDSTVYGMEASVTLPVGSSPKTAICLQVGSLNPFGQHIAELMNDSGNGAGFWIHDYVADTGVSTSASSATTFQVAVIHENEKNTFYINNKKVHELDASNFTPDWFGINTFENDGKAYTVYADNIGVLRRSSGSRSIQVAPLALSAFRDKVYLQGQNGPVEIDGASEINFDLQLIGQPTVSAATMTVDSVTYDLASFQAPTAFRTNYGYSSFDDELFDVESSSESDWNPYINGKTFNFNITVDGITYSYAHNLPAESSLPSTPNTSLAESSGWKTDSGGYEYQEARAGNSLTLTWDTFSLASSDDFITVSVEELVGDNEIEVMGSTSLPVTATSYEFPSNLFESGKKYTLYVAFHKVLESENPTGFEHQTGTNTSQPLLITTARAVTAVDVVIVDTTPVTVVSDPNGQAVVVQVGNEYQWNSTLDGVTLWGVEQSSDGWSSMTMRFENGRNFGNEGFYDSVAQPQPYDAPYEIDENGYIKSLEDDGDYQYYNAVSVENGVIGTIQNDEGVDSVANNGTNQVDQWFFTTRAAAEEYYYSKVNPKDWMWFDNYPWVYSNEKQEWLYFYPSGSKLLYYSNKNQAWREFSQ